MKSLIDNNSGIMGKCTAPNGIFMVNEGRDEDISVPLFSTIDTDVNLE